MKENYLTREKKSKGNEKVCAKAIVSRVPPRNEATNFTNWSLGSLLQPQDDFRLPVYEESRRAVPSRAMRQQISEYEVEQF